MSEVPYSRTTSAGFQIKIDKTDQGVWVFTLYDEEVAHLAPPTDDAAPRTDGYVEWGLTYPIGYPSTTVLGEASEPPIDGVLFNLDVVLEEEGYEP